MQWASRVKPGLIRRLYRLDRDGVYDDALLDRAGWGLHARCRDVLTVCRAVPSAEARSTGSGTPSGPAAVANVLRWRSRVRTAGTP